MKIGDSVIGKHSFEVDGFIEKTHTSDIGNIHFVIWKGGYSSWHFEKDLLDNLQNHRDNIIHNIINI